MPNRSSPPSPMIQGFRLVEQPVLASLGDGVGPEAMVAHPPKRNKPENKTINTFFIFSPILVSEHSKNFIF
jgi:hypothetical protein